MSFQDLASGGGGGGGGGRVAAKPQQQQQQDNPMQAIASGLFQITTAMSRFQRHVHTLGTPQDTPQLRAKLRKTSSHIQYLMDETKAKLDQANWRVLSDPGKKLAIARFEKDYHAVLKQFLNVQHLAYQREETLAAAAAAALLPLSTYPDDNKPPAPDLVLVFDNEVAFNEALIEEREEEIKVVQQQIADLSETFREVAILVQQQGEMIDVVETNIVSSHEATTQAKSQLLEASTTQETDSSCNCLLLVILGVVLIIVIILIMA